MSDETAAPADQDSPPFDPGAVTTAALRDIADYAESSACAGDTMQMAFALGRIAQWADTAARTAEASDG